VPPARRGDVSLRGLNNVRDDSTNAQKGNTPLQSFRHVDPHHKIHQNVSQNLIDIDEDFTIIASGGYNDQRQHPLSEQSHGPQRPSTNDYMKEIEEYQRQLEKQRRQQDRERKENQKNIRRSDVNKIVKGRSRERKVIRNCWSSDANVNKRFGKRRNFNDNMREKKRIHRTLKDMFANSLWKIRRRTRLSRNAKLR